MFNFLVVTHIYKLYVIIDYMEMIEEVLETKKKCEECGKHFKHLEKCKDGKIRCKKCKRNQITNKWYIPKEQRINDKIGKFSMTNQEKIVLVQTGHSWKEVNGACKYMNKAKMINKYLYFKKLNEENKKKEQDKQIMVNLIQGLRSYKE